MAENQQQQRDLGDGIGSNHDAPEAASAPAPVPVSDDSQNSGDGGFRKHWLDHLRKSKYLRAYRNSTGYFWNWRTYGNPFRDESWFPQIPIPALPFLEAKSEEALMNPRERGPVWIYKQRSEVSGGMGEDLMDMNIEIDPQWLSGHTGNARERMRRKIRDIEGRSPNWKFQKVLGHGGCGIVAHYKCVNPGNPCHGDVAMKFDLYADQSVTIAKEDREMTKFTRASHIAQRLPRKPIGGRKPWRRIIHDPPSDDSSEEELSSGDESVSVPMGLKRKRRKDLTESELNKKRRRWNHEAANPSPSKPTEEFLLTEFFPLGDLESLIKRIVRKTPPGTKTRIPKLVLWPMWLCLLQQCVALAYPPRKFHKDRLNNDGVEMDIDHDLDEYVPSERELERLNRSRKNNIHFDMTPGNMFLQVVADDDNNSEKNKNHPHTYAPKIKLGDFGLAEEIKEEKRDCYYLRRRIRGKERLWAPEQFSSLPWDNLPDTHADATNFCSSSSSSSSSSSPSPSPPPQSPFSSSSSVQAKAKTKNKTPYTPPFNLYQAASVLFNLYTTFSLPHRPLSASEFCPPLSDDDPLCRHLPGSGSHGLPLLADKSFFQDEEEDGEEEGDLEMRIAMVKCMAYDPEERPELGDLIEEAKGWIERLEEGGQERREEEAVEWVRKWVVDADCDDDDDGEEEGVERELGEYMERMMGYNFGERYDYGGWLPPSLQQQQQFGYPPNPYDQQHHQQEQQQQEYENPPPPPFHQQLPQQFEEHGGYRQPTIQPQPQQYGGYWNPPPPPPAPYYQQQNEYDEQYYGYPHFQQQGWDPQGPPPPPQSQQQEDNPGYGYQPQIEQEPQQQEQQEESHHPIQPQQQPHPYPSWPLPTRNSPDLPAYNSAP